VLCNIFVETLIHSKIEIFFNIKNAFTVTFDQVNACLMNLTILLNGSAHYEI